jgi:hypothetical protein
LKLTARAGGEAQAKEQFYRDTMQQLVLSKSRCQSELMQTADVADRMSREAAALEAAYEARKVEVEALQGSLSERLESMAAGETRKAELGARLDALAMEEASMVQRAQADPHLEAEVSAHPPQRWRRLAWCSGRRLTHIWRRR